MSDLKSLRKKNTAKNISNGALLSSKELEFLLELIAKSNFEGRDVQIVYETAVKLQKLIIDDK